MTLYLYHGTSSAFAEDIIKNGFKSTSTDSPYVEAREIFAKYVNPEILTDKFFNSYAGAMSLKTVSSIGLRATQSREAVGPFCCQPEHCSSDHYMSVPAYAHAITRNGAGEFETGVVGFLNSLQNELKEMEKIRQSGKCVSASKYELLNILIDNAKPEFREEDGSLKFKTRDDVSKDFPIVFKIKANSRDDVHGGGIDCRIKHEVKPEDIVGVAFLPMFETRSIPILDFMPKEEFIKKLGEHKKNGNKYENFIVRSKLSQKIEYAVSFPDEHSVLEQKFDKDEKPRETTLFHRDGLINKGRICRKKYRDGNLSECELYEDDKLRYYITFNNDEIAYASSYDDDNIKERYRFEDGISRSRCVYDKNNENEKYDKIVFEEFFLDMIPEMDFKIDTKVDSRVESIRKKLQKPDKRGIKNSYLRAFRVEEIENNTGQNVEMDLTKKKIGSITENIEYMKKLKETKEK